MSSSVMIESQQAPTGDGLNLCYENDPFMWAQLKLCSLLKGRNMIDSSSIETVRLEITHIIETLVAHCHKIGIPLDQINGLISLSGKILGNQSFGIDSLQDKVKEMNLKE